jgi:hypothetical protein
MHDIDPAAWLALDEDERISLVTEFHEAVDVDLPDVMMHAMFHVVIENQVALGDETPVANKLGQLRAEGLDRHDAIHALASVLVNHFFEGLYGADPARGNDDYYSDLEALTAESWLQTECNDSADDEDPRR